MAEPHRTLHEYKDLLSYNDTKRRGCRMTRSITAGNRILVDRPLLWVIDDRLDDQRPDLDTDDYLKKRFLAAYEELPNKSKNLYKALFCKKTSPNVYDIFATNAVAIDGKYIDVVENGRRKRSKTQIANGHAVFPKFSRINHSCSPNSWYEWDATNNRMEVRALRPLNIREEITVNYRIDLQYSTRAVRRAELATWGFGCDCEACGLAPREVKASDERRRQMLDLDAKIRRHNQDNNQGGAFPKEFPDLIYDFLHLLKQEGILYPGPADLRFDLARWWYDLATQTFRSKESAARKQERRDEGKLALKVAQTSLDMHVKATGVESKYVAEILELINAISAEIS